MATNSIDLNFERELSFRKSEKCFKGTVRIDRLFLNENSKWTCHLSIDYICESGAKIYRVDLLDPLTQDPTFIGHLIEGTIEDGIDIWWKYEGGQGRNSEVPSR